MDGTTHDLLLALAGRLDDDMLAWARELVAVGEDTRAVELVAAGLAADRSALPAPLRTALVEAARTARIDLDADRVLPAPATVDPEHRFAAAPASCDDHVARALAALPARLLDGAEVLLTWRLTPAGGAPGSLPHPVVLVEVGPAGRPADVLAYQLSVALDRAGVVASVEVLTSGRPVSAYHAAARSEARRVDGSTATPPVAVPEPEVIEPVAAEPVVESAFSEPDIDEVEPPAPERSDSWSAGLFGMPDEPDATVTDPTGDVLGDVSAEPAEPTPRSLPRRAVRDTDPDPRPAPRPLERRRTTVTPLSRAFLPSPVPLARRDSSRPRPLAPVADEQDAAPETTAYPPSEQGQIPALADTPTFRSMQDPLSGPLNAPLLAPLLDPTPRVDADDTPHDDDPFGPAGISPLAPDRPGPAPAPVEDRWANEWASGDWAVSPSDLRADHEPEPVAPSDEPELLTVDEPHPGTDEEPRHRVSFGSPAEPPSPLAAPSPPAAPSPAAAPQNPGPPEPPAVSPPRPGPGRARPPAAERAEPVDEGRVGDGLGLRPDSVARLSDADRELLARLQSELGTGPRARTSRRAGVAPPRSNGNGNGRVDPPDLAG